jgi:tRNA pseudouridine-54 N-methylase
MDHDGTLGDAYVSGMIAARAGQAISCNPFYQHTQQCIAFVSGYRDQMAWGASRAEADGEEAGQ